MTRNERMNSQSTAKKGLKKSKRTDWSEWLLKIFKFLQKQGIKRKHELKNKNKK